MQEYLDNIMKKIEFPDEAHAFYMNFYNKLTDKEIFELFSWQDLYFKKMSSREEYDQNNMEVTVALKAFAAKYGYDYRCIHMLFALLCTKRLHEDYNEAGLGDELFYEIAKDLKYKVVECYKYDGIWGSMTFFWFHRHFLVDRFALGRFQFEEIGFKEESYNKNGVSLKKGDRVINIHIPSSGAMTDEIRLESYKKAYEFFKKDNEKYVVFVCHSWLLYPSLENIYPIGSNLYNFMKEFDIISEEVHPVLPFPNAWRVFYKDYYGDNSVLTENTTLERNIANWLRGGNKIGSGYGVIVFDGEKIVN